MHSMELLMRQNADTMRQARKEFQRHAICSMAQELSDINRQNSLDLVVEATKEPVRIHALNKTQLLF